jgi:hypothetical protein
MMSGAESAIQAYERRSSLCAYGIPSGLSVVISKVDWFAFMRRNFVLNSTNYT